MPSGQKIADLYAALSLDANAFSKALADADSKMSSAGQRMSKLETSARVGLAGAFAVAGAAIVAFGAVIVKGVGQAKNMEQGIADIRAVMNTTAPAAAELQKVIGNLGLDPRLKVTSVEASAAIEMLVKNGRSWEEVSGGMARSTILLANAVGDKGFATSADVATDAMAQFGLEAADMDMVANQVTGTIQSSKFNINDYALALAQAGGVAGAVGVEFDDFNAVIAAISPLFASGSDAGTSFKTFLQRLSPTTKAQSSAMAELNLLNEDGTTRFYDASGALKSMDEVSKILAGSFAGLSEAQRNEMASTLFGTDAMRAAFALMDAGTTGEIAKYKEAIGNVDAEDAAATRMDTLAGAWEVFMGIVDALTTQLGFAFLPAVRNVVEWLIKLASDYGPRVIEWANRMGVAFKDATETVLAIVTGGALFEDQFKKLPEPIQNVIKGVTGFMDATKALIKPIADSISKVVSWQDVLIAAAGALVYVMAPAILFLGGPILTALAWFASLTATVAAMRLAWEHDFGNIRTDVTAALTYLNGVFAGTLEAIKQFGGGALEEIAAWAAGNKTSFENTTRIWEAAKGAMRTLKEDIVNSLLQLMPEWKSNWGAMGNFFSNIMGKLGIESTTTTNNMGSHWDNFVANLMGYPLQTLERLFTVWIPGFLYYMVQDAKMWFNNMVINAKTRWQDMVNDAKHWWDTLVYETGRIITHWLGEISYKFQQFVWDIEIFWGHIRRNTQLIWNDIVEWTMKKWEAWFGWFKPLEWIKAGRDIIQGLWDGLKEKWTLLSNWAGSTWQGLIDRFKKLFGISSPSTVFKAFGMHIGEGLAQGLGASLPAASTVLTTFGNNLVMTADGIIRNVADRTGQLQTAIAGFTAAQLANAAVATTPFGGTPYKLGEIQTTPAGDPAFVKPAPGSYADTRGGNATGGANAGGAIESIASAIRNSSIAQGIFAQGGGDVSQLVTSLDDFGRSLNDMLGKRGIGTFGMAGVPEENQLSQAQTNALNLLTGLPSDNAARDADADKVNSAIFELIQVIKERGLGSKFEISGVLPATQGNVGTTIEFLTALYGT